MSIKTEVSRFFGREDKGSFEYVQKLLKPYGLSESQEKECRKYYEMVRSSLDRGSCERKKKC